MKIHKEAKPVIITAIITWTVFYIVIAHYTDCNKLCCQLTGITGSLVLVFILRFFRNPKRKVHPDPNILFAPADGKIVAIEEEYVAEYLQREYIRVSIFMSIWNVHVNRYPVSGKIVYSQYHSGNYYIASHPKSSELNEHQTVVIKKTEGTEIMVKQIAGTVARRVACYAIPGQHIKQGDDLGFIRFGSRVDLFFPVGSEILIRMHEKVKGNITKIAQINGGQ